MISSKCFFVFFNIKRTFFTFWVKIRTFQGFYGTKLHSKSEKSEKLLTNVNLCQKSKD